jgi:hypothetical protein
MNEELRLVRDALIEELRRSDILTVAARSLYSRFAQMTEAELAAAEGQQQPAAPGPDLPPAPPPRRRPTAADDDDEFGGSFMVRNAPAQPTIPGYRAAPPPEQQTPADLPRSLRHRRR